MACSMIQFLPFPKPQPSTLFNSPLLSKNGDSSLVSFSNLRANCILICQAASIKSNSSSVDPQQGASASPPLTREEAVLQAKKSLCTSLEKNLNNPRIAGKLRKPKQLRLRVEIPVLDDSPDSLTKLANDLFSDISIKRKGDQTKILLLFSNRSLAELANKGPGSLNLIQNSDFSSISKGSLASSDVMVFMAPGSKHLDDLKELSDGFYPKPVVMFNPGWTFEQESDFGELSGFVGSFDVVYSFTGLEVRGILSRRKAMVIKNASDGVLSGEKWLVLVEEDGEMKVISRFKKRPSVGEVENILYNLMAMNSPVTKSVKFVRNFVSKVSGRTEAKKN